MSVSRPSVHPVEAPPLTDVAALRVRMKDVQGMPGTACGLFLRLFQFIFAVVSLAVMASTNDFPSVTAFRYLVAAVGLQCLWSLSMTVVDLYAILVRRSLRNCKVVCFFTIGDGIASTLTFAAACASAGITVLIANDLNKCAVNHCRKFESATAMAFMSCKEDEEEKRLYRCARTYNKIVGQFDELMEIMNTKTRPPKRSKNSTNGASAAATQHEHNEVIVQTVTRFLYELRTDASDAECSSTTSRPH